MITTKTLTSLAVLTFLGACCISGSRPDDRPAGSFEASASAAGAPEVRARVEAFYRGGPEALGRTATAADDFGIRRVRDRVEVGNAHLEERDAESWRMDIELAVPAHMDLEIVNGVGDCHVAGCGRSVSVQVGVGAATVEADALERAAVDVGTGRVDLRVSRDGPTAGATCEVGTGDISVQVPATFGGQVSLSTGVGSIDLRNAPGVVVERGPVSEDARGRIGTDPATVTCDVGTGSIDFSRE